MRKGRLHRTPRGENHDATAFVRSRTTHIERALLQKRKRPPSRPVPKALSQLTFLALPLSPQKRHKVCWEPLTTYEGQSRDIRSGSIAPVWPQPLASGPPPSTDIARPAGMVRFVPDSEVDRHPDIDQRGKSLICLSSPIFKNISLHFQPKSHAYSQSSRAHKRGVSRSSRTLGAGSDGRESAATDERD